MGDQASLAYLWRARCRGNLHAGFGGRDGETGRPERPVPRSVPTLLLPVCYGFRPKRLATQAVERLRMDFIEGRVFVVEFDIRNLFGEIDHDRLLFEVGRRISDRRVRKLLRLSLQAV